MKRFGQWLLILIKKNINSNYERTTCFWYYDIICTSNNRQKECDMFYDLFLLFYEDYKNKEGYFEWRKT